MKTKSILLASIVTMALSACGNPSTADTRRVVKFEFLRGGFGTEVYEALANAYMEQHPDVRISLVPNRDINSTTASKLEANSNLSDLYSVRSVLAIDQWVVKGLVYDLTDLYQSEIEDGKTLLNMMEAGAADYSFYNGHYYSIPEYTSVSGWVYNASLFAKYGWKIPTTTKEMENLCQQILTDTEGKVAPIVYCGAAADGYLYLATDSWMDSYAGVTNLDTFYRYESPEVFNPSGEVSKAKRYAMDNLKKFFGGDYVMKGSASKTHIIAQRDILQGNAAMMINGSWFENEMKAYMKDNPDLDLRMFASPSVSDESNHVLHSSSYTTEDDKPVIDAGIGASYFIPKNAHNVADALDFLKFINTSAMSELYTSMTNAIRPMQYNRDSASNVYAKMSNFGKSVLDIAKNNVLYLPRTHNAIAMRGYISLYPQGGYWNYKILNDPQTYTDDYCLQSDYEYVKSNWSAWQSL